MSEGWQTVLRSTNIFGPYEDKIVLAQGKTEINGPHQGGWVETQIRRKLVHPFPGSRRLRADRPSATR